MVFRVLFLWLLVVGFAAPAFAQHWSPAIAAQKKTTPGVEVSAAHYARTDAKALQQLLFAAPHESVATTKSGAVKLNLPTPSGEIAHYTIVAYDISAAAGLKRFPNIRTFYGYNTEEPTEQIYLDWTATGMHASISGGHRGDFLIDPTDERARDTYRAYYLRDVRGDDLPGHTCGIDHDTYDLTKDIVVDAKSAAVVGDLVEYRAAISTTVEYSKYFGATSFDDIDLVHSAVVTAINRVNAVFVRDAGARLQLIDFNEFLYNFEEEPELDPFNTTQVTNIDGLNQEFLDEVLGNDQYDIGHALHRVDARQGVLGRAVIGGLCNDDFKGTAVSSLDTPDSPIFISNVLAHEIGHQFGASHPFTTPTCGFDGRNIEPISGSTIMGQAGFCSTSIQPANDLYFNGFNILQMRGRVRLTSCGETVQTADFSISRQSALSQRHAVPAGVPFALTVDVGAAPGAQVLYNWEGADATQPPTTFPQPENETGPQFRSFPPVASPTRYFPNLPDLLSNTPTPLEVLPTVGRELRFRNTATEIKDGFGLVVQQTATVTTIEVDEPTFAVTDPATGNQWSTGQTAAVRWNVGGTFDFTYFDLFTPSVDIILVTDDGATFTTLAEEVDNNGEYTLTVPDIVTDRAWIIVKGHNRIFFNVSPQPFRIVSGAGEPRVELAGPRRVTFNDCDIADGTFTVDLTTASFGGADAPITWSVRNLPSFMDVTFERSAARAGESNSATISGFDQLQAPFYSFRFIGRSADGRVTKLATLRRTSPLITPFAIEPSFFTFVDIRPTLEAFVPAIANPSSFEFQVAEDAGFEDLVFSQAGLEEPRVTLPFYLESETTYYFRVRMVNDCVLSDWDDASFTTGDCRFYFSAFDDPVVESGTTVDLPILVEDEGEIVDVDVADLTATGFSLSRNVFSISNPAGETAELFGNQCGSIRFASFVFDDESDRSIDDCDDAESGEFYRPATPLSQLDGSDAAGVWNLTVENNSTVFATEVEFAAIKVCYAADFFGFFNLTATGLAREIQLTWETELKSTTGFTVERRMAGDSDWAAIGKTEASQSLGFTDGQVDVGLTYEYRLRQTGVDGRVSYSNSALAATAGETGFSLFPNPSAGVVHYRAETDAGRGFQLLDVAGKQLTSGTLRASGELDLSPYNSGIYLLRVGDRVHRIVRL